MSTLAGKDERIQSKNNSVSLLPDLVELKEPGPLWERTSLPLTRQHLSSAQQVDETLQNCFENMASAESANKEKQAYIVEQGVSMHQWSLSGAESSDLEYS